MQPYFFPYLGYFQLINSVDTFVIYDNIEFTKSGWIRRNRILNGNRDRYIIIPLKKASDYSRVCDLQIAKTYDFKKMLRIIRGAYERAPYFNHTYQLLKNIIPPEIINFLTTFYTLLKACAPFLKYKPNLLFLLQYASTIHSKRRRRSSPYAGRLMQMNMLIRVAGNPCMINVHFQSPASNYHSTECLTSHMVNLKIRFCLTFPSLM
jgi:hypothetical protein